MTFPALPAVALCDTWTRKAGFTHKASVLVLDVSSMFNAAQLATATVAECEAFCAATPGCAAAPPRTAPSAAPARLPAGPATACHRHCRRARANAAGHFLPRSCNAYDICESTSGACGAYCIDHNKRNPAGEQPLRQPLPTSRRRHRRTWH